jgi:hypothetical protein
VDEETKWISGTVSTPDREGNEPIRFLTLQDENRGEYKLRVPQDGYIGDCDCIEEALKNGEEVSILATGTFDDNYGKVDVFKYEEREVSFIRESLGDSQLEYDKLCDTLASQGVSLSQDPSKTIF